MALAGEGVGEVSEWRVWLTRKTISSLKHISSIVVVISET